MQEVLNFPETSSPVVCKAVVFGRSELCKEVVDNLGLGCRLRALLFFFLGGGYPVFCGLKVATSRNHIQRDKIVMDGLGHRGSQTLPCPHMPHM